MLDWNQHLEEMLIKTFEKSVRGSTTANSSAYEESQIDLAVYGVSYLRLSLNDQKLKVERLPVESSYKDTF
jgi:predicted nucleotidyltransferase